MEAVNVTIRMDKETKREFEKFCENVGINITTAFSMFVKATLRTRELPFAVTDVDSKSQARKTFGEALKISQKQSVINGTENLSMDEINEVIAECRRDSRM